ncbi:hypothetical protein N408_04920 [Helicobacter pylori FD703]|uniref:DUF3519 domain-containing protein n=1 Tax=Helicobacter pylori TaxID=210 RepID=UPI00038E13B8|nr:DUF3519 domain-containing protein [Helicobacter pylori]EQL66789.1 hypothetical protein N408_04920 [Helicobacter pylori FD703]
MSNIVRNIPTTYIFIFRKLDELSGGAALKYHIQRALERSHTISAFTNNLELSAKNSKFSNATMRKIEEITQGVKSAKENITKQEEALQDAITPLKEFGKNYAEFVLKPKEALEKLLQEKNGQVAGAAFRDDLGGIDFVWGKDGKDGYGLAHILERREDQALSEGLNQREAKEYALNVVKSIPEIIEKGVKVDNNGRMAIEYKHMRVGLNDKWDNQKLENKWVISSYEIYNSESGLPFRPIAQLQEVGLEPSKLTEPNPTTNTLKNQEPLNALELANAEKLRKLQDAITPLKEFGKNYAEFVLKPKEALEKLLQEKNGQVAGAAFRDDLGGIDFVWGKDGKDGYGLAHILEKREKQYTRLGLNAEQIKERTDELLKSIPEVIEKGTLFKDDLGRVSVELNNIRVGLKNTWDNNNLNNHFVVTSYERDEKVLRELETKPPLSNDYKGNSNYSALNLNENNLTKESLTSQEPPLSILEKSQLEKQKKLESERLAKAEKERAQKIKDQEEAELRDKIRAQKNATLGKSELDREIAKSENIPYKELENAPKTSVSLNDDEIHPLKFVIVNKSDLKPNFKNTGTQTRTAVDSKKVEEIAERFDPKLIIGRGGFDDLPIILRDGQVIAGNHRIQGMLNFNAESRKKYEQALKENFNIELKPDELLVRMPEQELNDKEIFKLASKSNENRANSFSDTLLSAMSSYNDKLKHLPPQFESDSVENLANQVARVLERDAKIPSPTQVENANLSLLSHYARNTPNNSFLEVFDNAYKNLDRDQFKAFKEMFAYNSANFHNLNNDTTIKNFTISPYLTDALDTTAKMLESGNRADNFSKLAHDIDYLVNSTDENGMNAFIKENKDAYNSVISELLGSSFARFLRLENPSVQFYEFLVKAKDRMIENTADIFTGTSKPISQINVFDFIKYGIESGRSSKESRELLDLLPELEKKFNAYERLKQEPLNALKLETKKGIKAEAVNKLNLDEIKKLIDESPRTGSSMPILGMQNLNAEAVEYIQKNHKRIAVEKIEPSFAKDLKLKYPDDARAVIDYQAINHILKEHKNLSYEDIANYRELSKQANETFKLKDNQNRPVVASFNQIDGFFVVVEQVSNAKNELMLKTMYKARENYKDSLIYKKTLAKSQNSN